MVIEVVRHVKLFGFGTTGDMTLMTSLSSRCGGGAESSQLVKLISNETIQFLQRKLCKCSSKGNTFGGKAPRQTVIPKPPGTSGMRLP